MVDVEEGKQEAIPSNFARFNKYQGCIGVFCSIMALMILLAAPNPGGFGGLIVTMISPVIGVVFLIVWLGSLVITLNLLFCGGFEELQKQAEEEERRLKEIENQKLKEKEKEKETEVEQDDDRPGPLVELILDSQGYNLLKHCRFGIAASGCALVAPFIIVLIVYSNVARWVE